MAQRLRKSDRKKFERCI